MANDEHISLRRTPLLSENFMKISILLLLLLSFQVYASDVGRKADVKAMTTIFSTTKTDAPVQNEPMHCEANEEIVFNCKVGKKILSICGSPKIPPYQSLEYRYGAKDKIEMRYTANHANKNRFHGLIGPLNPKASVDGIWFSRGDIDYVISACTGGDCPVEAGLVVLKKGKPIFSKACGSNIYGDKNNPFYGHASFEPKIVEFGSDFPDSSSKTDLLILEEDYTISVDDLSSLYPNNGVLY